MNLTKPNIRRLAEAGHRQKDIAQVVGLTKGHVSEIVNKKSSETEHEPTIKTSSAVEEIAVREKEGLSLPRGREPDSK